MVVEFPPFRADLEQARLWREGQVVPLRRRTWEVLRYLLSRPAELVTVDDLVGAIWSNAAVQDAVVTNCVYELRRALADDRRKPRFIAAVHGQGFRWVAETTTIDPNQAHASGNSIMQLPSLSSSTGAEPDVELQRLRARWALACCGQRQVVFITGDSGPHMTSLVSRFCASLDEFSPLIIRGQCREAHREPYAPLLDALARVGSGPIREVFRRCAPTWLAQMPSRPAGRKAAERTTRTASKERLLRELAAAFATIADRGALVLVLEELQWADPATLDTLSFLIRRDASARMLVVGTYRIAAATGHSRLVAFANDLLARSGVVEIALAPVPDSASGLRRKPR